MLLRHRTVIYQSVTLTKHKPPRLLSWVIGWFIGGGFRGVDDGGTIEVFVVVVLSLLVSTLVAEVAAEWAVVAVNVGS